MSHGFYASDPLRAHDLFYKFELIIKYNTTDADGSAQGFQTMTHYES